MNQKTKITLLLASGVLVLGTLCGLIFRKEVLIAYHKNRFIAAGQNMAMETPRTLFQLLKISFFRMNHAREAEAIQKHEAALIALGYLHQQEFRFTNCSWQGTNGQYFFQCMTHAFSRQPCWTCKFPATNRIEVVALLEDMPKWKKLVADFDHS